jgi:hypothetical protein
MKKHRLSGKELDVSSQQNRAISKKRNESTQFRRFFFFCSVTEQNVSKTVLNNYLVLDTNHNESLELTNIILQN